MYGVLILMHELLLQQRQIRTGSQVLSKSPAAAGVFVYRHLGLAGCNIVYMKRFLPLLILKEHNR